MTEVLDSGVRRGRHRRLGTASRWALARAMADLCLHRDAAAARTDAEGVHGMRVAARRLRAVLEGYRRAFRDVPVGAEFDASLRALLDDLGALRDLDVLQETIAELANDEGDGRFVQRLLQSIADERAEAERKVDSLLGRFETAMIVPLTALIALAAGGRPARVELWRQLHRRGERLAGRIAEASVNRSPEALHAVRKAARRLRYMAEIAESTFSDADAQRAKRIRAAAKDLQGRLGRIHDLDVLIARLVALPPGDEGAPSAEQRIAAFRSRAEEARSTALADVESLLSPHHHAALFSEV